MMFESFANDTEIYCQYIRGGDLRIQKHNKKGVTPELFQSYRTQYLQHKATIKPSMVLENIAKLNLVIFELLLLLLLL